MDYLVTFSNDTQVEVTNVKEPVQKYGFLEFRGSYSNDLVIAYRTEFIYSYEQKQGHSVKSFTIPVKKPAARKRKP